MGDLNELVERLRVAVADRDAAPWDYDEELTETYRQALGALISLIAERDGLRDALNNSHQLAATARDRRSTAAAPAPADIQAIVEATRPIANPAANNALSLDTNKGDGV